MFDQDKGFTNKDELLFNISFWQVTLGVIEPNRDLLFIKM